MPSRRAAPRTRLLPLGAKAPPGTNGCAFGLAAMVAAVMLLPERKKVRARLAATLHVALSDSRRDAQTGLMPRTLRWCMLLVHCVP